MSGIVGSLFNIKGGSGPVAVMGTDGQQLTSQGAGIKCQFEAAAGGGKMVQFLGSSDTTSHQVVSGDGLTATTLSVAITATSSSNKFLVGYCTQATMYDVVNVSAGSGFEVRRSEDGGSFDRLSPNVDGNGDAPSCFATYLGSNDPSGYFYSQQRFNAHFWDPTTTPSTEVIFKMYIKEADVNETYFAIGQSGYYRSIWCAEVDQS